MILQDSALRELLRGSRTIAVVGAKDTPGQPVDRVGRYLIAAGYNVIPVHPVRKSVWGLSSFANLADIPYKVDIVDVFRAPAHCPGHAREAISLNPLPGLFWMQLGIQSPEAAAILRSHDVPFVENACLMVEHMRIFG